MYTTKLRLSNWRPTQSLLEIGGIALINTLSSAGRGLLLTAVIGAVTTSTDRRLNARRLDACGIRLELKLVDRFACNQARVPFLLDQSDALNR
ncbi:hypothetical protein EVAR_25938_1 [Eumeta japonica]|uniref:Uncharacterized protein n=1 Tax=Eumeta variegata TaxID=151549 RepID=A0A4C1S9K0_EUMVA|nr:hypothetical protein EVAR_25938_1 [Eumeta japonica]